VNPAQLGAAAHQLTRSCWRKKEENKKKRKKERKKRKTDYVRNALKTKARLVIVDV
jgi:hypothetical protein